jgi:NAD(P)H dehydrogenase (quinone)
MEGKLIGKLGSAFCATGTQHGGQETTIQSMFSTFLHHGMLIAGLPYSEKRIMEMGEITGGGPNGATTMSNVDGSRLPSENELAIARSQGAHIAALALKLAE